MVAFLIQLLCAFRARFTRRARLEAENLLLRQQLVSRPANNFTIPGFHLRLYLSEINGFSTHSE